MPPVPSHYRSALSSSGSEELTHSMVSRQVCVCGCACGKTASVSVCVCVCGWEEAVLGHEKWKPWPGNCNLVCFRDLIAFRV